MWNGTVPVWLIFRQTLMSSIGRLVAGQGEVDMATKGIGLKEAAGSDRARLLYALLSVDQPEHPLHAHYQAIALRLRQVGTVPGMLTVEDLHRVAAQVLLETWLVGMETVDRIGVDAQERLLVWQNDADGGDPFCIALEVMPALAYSVSESTLALEEAMAAWPISARQRRVLATLPTDHSGQAGSGDGADGTGLISGR